MNPELGKKIITEILTELYKRYNPKSPPKQLNIYTTAKNAYGYSWAHFGTRFQRSIESIFIDKDVKNKMVDSLTKFYKSSELYDKYDICWKRVHILS